ncbi:MAG TPA: DUF4143 domain-containing protein [Acidimicrobiales bacterium]|nr:DUF4143 domain-containing protein [Acidimicrobiales bacterium]
MTTTEYRARLVDGLLEDLFSELPALAITGPRATGKTTTAARHARTVVRLDRAAEAAAFHADPDAALAGLAEPVLLDEWQEVPQVLGAVKRSLDGNYRPARFLLTGSVRAELEGATWPGTGRVVRVPMYGMTVRELHGSPNRAFLDRLVDGDALALPEDVPDLRGYVRLALAGGFPEPVLRLGEQARTAWLESYIEQLVTRDAPAVNPGRDPARLRRYFETFALNTAGTASESTIFGAAGLNRKTAAAYERLLTNLFVIDAVPAWTSNRLRRLSARPKRYVVDAALAASLLRVDERAVLRDGDLLGRIIDTFVVSQLRAELPLTRARPRLYHLREEHGRHEVDLVAELGGEKVVAIEVKATAAPTRDDARHLIWLRDQLDDRFVRGVVFHTGPRTFGVAQRIDAVPICALWG